MLTLPERIQSKLPNEPYVLDDIGMSSSTVVLFSDKVLKIQPVSKESANEANMLAWLDGKLPVPKVDFQVEEQGMSYLLMSRVKGKMACDEAIMKKPTELVKRLAQGIRRFWDVEVSGCPGNFPCSVKLQMAKENIEAGRVDVDDAEPETYGANGFQSPLDLWNWLFEHRPQEELVFSHGDYCLPNVFLDEAGITGFLDLGSAGMADKWQDIALCYRSLKHNYDGRYGGTPNKEFHPDLLFQELGIEPDWEKIRYYLLLDELF